MRDPVLIELPDLEWIEILRVEASKPKKTIQDVANEIGMKRCSLSLLLSGNYPAKLNKVTRKYAPKVMALYAHRVWCPHVMRSIGTSACEANHSGPMPMSDPVALRQWVACRSCPQNPQAEKVTHAG